jgi:hypothetical protein
VVICYPLLLQLKYHTTELYLHAPSPASHAWTSFLPYQGPDCTTPELGLRQIWVHGNFMGSLNHQLLEQGLAVQKMLLGPASGCDKSVWTDEAQSASPSNEKAPGDGEQESTSWSGSFFHSPLMYWNCDSEQLKSDPHLLRTINQRSHQKSTFNLTLTPSTVFAGKIFNGTKLVAADALMISFFYNPNNRTDEEWSQRYRTLARMDDWDVYPRSVDDIGSWLYELRYQPMTSHEATVLVLCYVLMAVYLLLKLISLKVLKSRLGFVIVVITEVRFSG